MEDFISAKECIDNFGKMGIEITESFFSKNKKKGYFRVHKLENRKRDLFVWDEVVQAYFAFNIPANLRDQKIRDDYFKKQKIRDAISIEWEKLLSYKELTFEMFNIEDLWISAAKNLKEIEEQESRGEIVNTTLKQMILEDVAKTKEEHIEEFKRDIFSHNEQNSSLRWFMEALTDDLSEIYSDFEESKILMDILKSANSWITTPKKMADYDAVSLIED